MNPSVEWVRHAVAIDERRTMFQPELWIPDQDYRGSPFKKVKGKQNFKQVWFAGVHGDVGGGYPEPDSGQVKIPLEWMIRETEPTGLLYRTQTVEDIVKGQRSNRYVSLNATADLHDSMSLGWKPLEYLPRRVPENSWRKRGDSRSIYIPFRDRRFIPERAMLHSSVRIRMEGGGYNPPNLPKDPFFVD
jgi:uncharacterized protein (DUF2235 family)